MRQNQKSDESHKITRRTLIATVSAVAATRLLPKIALSSGGRRILTVYFDKAAGAMRAVEKLIP